MSKRPPSGDVDVRLGDAAESSLEPLDPDTPFRILVLGDFGGSEGGSVATRKIHAVDRDTLEDELSRLGAALEVPLGEGPAARIALRTLEDLHPDRLLERVDALARFRATLERLEDPRTFAEAARDVRAWAGAEPDRREPATPVPAPDDVMADLLAGASRQAKRTDAAFEAELREIVRPHLAPEEDADLPRLREAVDDARARGLRALLADPRFREVEATWRTLDLLVHRVDDESVRIFFLDAPREALLADLRSRGTLSETGLYRRLVTETIETPGAEPWAAILCLAEFGPSVEDVAFLARLAKVARAAGAPVLAGARPALVGCASLAETPDPAEWRKPEDDGAAIWDELRALPEAAWVALAIPRVLVRLPYGAKTDPIDSFAFEEIPGAPANRDYTWGNGALACALALAGAFEQGGWDLRPESAAEIPGLPSHVFRDGVETRVTPPSEVVLTVRAAEKLIDAGLVPVLSLKGSESVRVARLQSIASPPRMLAGRWE